MTNDINFDEIIVETVEDEFPTPNHKASRERTNARQRKPPKDTNNSARIPPKRRGQFVQPLTNIYGTIGLTVAPIDPICGQAILASAENCAKTLDELAYQNDAVRRVLWSLTTTSAVGAVFIAHMPILMAIMVHHMPGFANRLQETGLTIAANAAEAMRENMAENIAENSDDSESAA